MDTWREDLLHAIFEGPTAEEAAALVEAQEREDAERREMVAERTLGYLMQMPMLAAAMTLNARPRQEGGGGSRPGSRVPSELVGISALDELWVLIGNWSTYVARVLDTPPPGAVISYAGRDEDVDGFQVWMSPTWRVAMVVEVSDWIRARHEAIQDLALASDLNSDIDSSMRRWLGMFPLEVPAQVLPRPCPTCERFGTVAVLWSDADGHHDDHTVECSHCGEVLARDLRAMKYHPEGCPGCIAASTPNHQNGDR